MTPHLHASCVSLDGRGVLIRGHSGAGKSAFALSLINRGFKLVSDDQVQLIHQNGVLYAKTFEALKGLIEVRGIGILTFDFVEECQIDYVFELIPGYLSDRFPKPDYTDILGCAVRRFHINALDPSSIEKVMAVMHKDFKGFFDEHDEKLNAVHA